MILDDMTAISGTYTHQTRPIVYFEARQDGERWQCIARSANERAAETTWSPSPWPMLERLIAQCLDSAGKQSAPPPFDMNRKLDRPIRPTPLRRRGSKLPPGSVPEWRPPEN